MRHRVRGRSALSISVLSAALVVSVLGPVPPALASPGGAPPTSHDKSVPGVSAKPRSVSLPDMPAWKAPAVTWPSSGSARVALTAGPNGGRHGQAKIGGLAVSVASADAAAGGVPKQSLASTNDVTAVSDVHVEVLDHATADALGAAVVLRVSSAEATATAGAAPVDVAVGYDSFRGAYGADWSNRLGLKVLPDCALTTPLIDGCRAGTWLSSINKADTLSVSADVDINDVVATAPGTALTAGVSTMSASMVDASETAIDSADGSVVLAVEATTSSQTEDFKQTQLSQSASWQAGGSSGDFSWSYPITVPPVPGGLAPSVALSYSSASVDGQTSTRNNQPGWIGQGWNYEPGFIERSFRPCGMDTLPVTPQWTPDTDSVCWRLPNAKIVWGGHATDLIPDNTSSTPNTAVPTVWHLADDDGTKVEYITGGQTSNTGYWNNEQWRITAKDGTQYWFGKSMVPGTRVGTGSVLGEAVISNHSGEPCYSSSSMTASYCQMAYRWNLDYVVDPHGNSMVYYYNREANSSQLTGTSSRVSYYRASTLSKIEFGMRAGAETTTPPARVLFTTVDRCDTDSTTCGAHDGTHWPDVPWDKDCPSGYCQDPPTFWTTKRLSGISAQVWTGTGTTYRDIDTYGFPASYPAVTSPETAVLWLKGIDHTGADNGNGITGGSIALPRVVFTGTRMENRALVASGSGTQMAGKYRITKIDNESGGSLAVTYSGIDTATCGNTANPPAAPDPANNFRRCFPQQDANGFTYWQKYLVNSIVESDNVANGPSVTHNYAYDITSPLRLTSGDIGSNTGVLWHHDMAAYGTDLSARTWSQWAGYPLVTETTGTAGSTMSAVMRVYFRGMNLDRTDAGDGTRVVTTTDTDNGAASDYDYRGGMLKEEITFSDNVIDRAHILSKVFHDPAPAVQTGAQTLSSSWAQSVNLKAYRVDTGWDRTMTKLAASGTWRTGQTDYTYDTLSNPLTTSVRPDTADTSATALDTCTTNTYLANTKPNLLLFAGTAAGANGVSGRPSKSVSGDWSAYDKTFPVGDFNGDGKKDFIVRSPATGALSYVPINGDGTVGSPTQIMTGWGGYVNVFSPGDFNGDGKPDVIGSLSDGRLFLWKGNGTGGFTGSVQIGASTYWSTYDLFSPGDVTGDGKPDIMGRAPTTGLLYVWPGNGTGSYSATTQLYSSGFDASTYVQMFGWGDYSGDTKADLLAADETGVWLYTNTGVSPYFPARVKLAEGVIGTIKSDRFTATGDFDGDSKADLLTRQSMYFASTVKQTTTVGVNCSATPSLPGDMVRDSRSYFDQPNATTPNLNVLPIFGDVTRMEQAKDYTGGTENWTLAGDSVYDLYGRPVTTKNALGKSTSTVYSESNGLTTSMTVNPPLAVAAITTTISPGRGLPVTVTDANNRVSTGNYDALGRTVKVWKGHSTSDLPDAEYAYSLSGAAAAPYVLTKTLNAQNPPAQVFSYQILDGLLRPRQTQTPTADGGRAITDLQYDQRGMQVKTSAFYNSLPPSSARFTGWTDPDILAQHRYTFDGVGRQLTDELWSANAKQWNVATNTYDGDRVNVDAPTGGTDTTTILDPLGRTKQLLQVRPAPASPNTSTYTYDDAGNLVDVADEANHHWHYVYDLLGRKTSSSDPDAGTMSLTYFDDGQVKTTTDARGKTLLNDYDDLGRRIGLYDGAVKDPAKQRAAWTYDTAAGGNGQLASSIRYTNGTSGPAYISQVTQYDYGYRPLHSDLIIPAAEGVLAGTYGTTYTYNPNGSPDTVSKPLIGGLPAETLTTGYNTIGQVDWLSSNLQTYIDSATYYYDGLIAAQVLGDPTGGKQVERSYTYDAARRIQTDRVDTEPGNWIDQVATSVYRYDFASNVTSIATKNAGVQDQAECFTYDYLRRLTDAWTEGSSNTCTTPQKAGVDPYWMHWVFDDVTGNRTHQFSYNADGSELTKSDYTYGPTSDPRPHILSSVATTGVGAGTKDFTYDAAGNTLARPGPGLGQQSLDFDPEGHLSSIIEGGATTSFVYDAGGSRLLRNDPGSWKTLTLSDGTELKASPSGAVAATRYYGVAVRTANIDGSGNLTGGDTLTWTLADHHGTGQIVINPTTLTVQRRRSMPFGEPRGSQPGGFGTKGFVGGSADPTGLTHLGAREYDPTIGRFTSMDPVFDNRDPQSWNGYTYSDNSPTTKADASGLAPYGCFSAEQCATLPRDPHTTDDEHAGFRIFSWIPIVGDAFLTWDAMWYEAEGNQAAADAEYDQVQANVAIDLGILPPAAIGLGRIVKSWALDWGQRAEIRVATGLVQKAFERGPVKYGTTALSKIAYNYRMRQNVIGGQNVAVYVVRDGNGTRVIISASMPESALHSEEAINAFIAKSTGKNKINPDDVVAVYSERVPCMSADHECALGLKQFKNADISWSYSDSYQSRATSNELNRAMRYGIV